MAKKTATTESRKMSREEMWEALVDMSDAILDGPFIVSAIDIHIVHHRPTSDGRHEGQTYGYILISTNFDHEYLQAFMTMVKEMGGYVNLLSPKGDDEGRDHTLRVWVTNPNG